MLPLLILHSSLFTFHFSVVHHQQRIAETAELIARLDSLLVSFDSDVVASEGSGGHHHRRLGVVEVCNQRVGKSEVVGREDELVRPAVERLQHTVGAHRALRGAQRAHADGTDAVSIVLFVKIKDSNFLQFINI